MRGTHLIAGSLFLFGSTACAATGDSCDIRSRGISMAVHAVDEPDGDSTHVRVEVDFEAGDRQGIGTRLDLCPSDVLTIAGEAPDEQRTFQRIVYFREFGDNAPRTIPIRFERDGAEVHEVVLTLPDPFTVTAPEPDAELSRAADVELTWDPAGAATDTMHIEVEEEVDAEICLHFASGSDLGSIDGEPVEDSGMWTVPANTLEAPAGAEPDHRCAAWFRLSRHAEADAPSGLDPSSSVSAEVVRRVPFTSAP